MARQLASIQRVLSVSPIEGADQIEMLTVLGWELVAKKGEFKPNDLCVYLEVDSICPQRPEFEFLAPVKYRIRTRRMRGQISQGIAFPLEIMLPFRDNMIEDGKYFLDLREGTDVSSILGVEKWSPQENDTGLMVNGQPGYSQTKGNFPSDLPKTDETRIQSVASVLEGMEETPFYVSEKIDGSSQTCVLRKNEETGELTFSVCSRNQEKRETPFCHFWYTARKMCLEEKMRSLLETYPSRFPQGLALQGELCGPGVQKNKLKLEDYTMFSFNVFDLATKTYLNFEEMRDVLSVMHLPMVPVVLEKVFFLPGTSVRELVDLATRRSMINPKVWAEGVVVRPLREMTHRKLGRFSFKIINPLFLLKHEE